MKQRFRSTKSRSRHDALALGAGLLTSPNRLTAGLPKCAPLRPGRETFGREQVRGQSPAHSSRPAHRVASHRGFTLIEMLIVITIFVFLLATAAMAIGTLFRAQSDLQDELIDANTTTRLAVQLRADAHLANSAEITREDATTTVRLLLPNANISYVTEARRIIRRETHGEREVHREVFYLLEGTTTDWALSAEQPAFLTLTTSFVSPALRASVARPREYRIETSIGLNAGGAR